jgi:DNA-binding PadR family transcriptional regulator
MEEMQLVQSRWEEESQGPRRRVYSILPDGREHLALWMEELRRSREEIDRLIKEYELEKADEED